MFNSVPIVLEAEFQRHVVIHLREAPITDDQIIEEVNEDFVLLRATVPDSLEMRLWLRGFGDEVNVLKPDSLRSEFREMAKHMQQYYAE